MRRRQVIALLTGLAAWAAEARAQEGKLPRIGVLGSHDDVYWDAFREGLRQLGYVDGRTIRLEYRWSEGKVDRFAELAAELVALPVDIIVTWGTPPAFAAKQATRTIPIVMASSGDPVGTGIVDSLTRPGGNVTGSASLNPDLEGKRIELLKEIVPYLSRLAVLTNPANPLHIGLVKQTEAAASWQKVETLFVPVSVEADLARAFTSIAQEKPNALIVLPDHFFLRHGKRIADFARDARLPSASTESIFAKAGGLMTYGVHYPELFRSAASFVDKVLKGTAPADLPVQQATRFELVINLKTARALNLDIPPTLLARADEVIE
jgi:putative tryptophan/tyrosine transport system substrate-binding protein